MSKHICFVFLALVLVACQPSSGLLTATFVMVYEQTQTAVPSQTLPPTSALPQTFTPHPAVTQTLPPTPPPTQTLTPSPTHILTQVIMADFSFSACAFLDVNGNGEWDKSDTPLEGAQMGVRIHEGQAFALGDLTRSDGCGFVFVPGGVIEAQVTIRMLPPKGSGLIPIGESEVVYQGGPIPRFLFRQP
jgi:hypothetical protein